MSAWIIAALAWAVASGATLRYLHTEASIISIVWILIAIVCTVLAVVVDLLMRKSRRGLEFRIFPVWSSARGPLTRRARGTGTGAVIVHTLGSAVTGLSLGFAIADAMMVSRGYAEPKGYLLAMAALVPTVLGLVIFLAPTMRERSRRPRGGALEES